MIILIFDIGSGRKQIEGLVKHLNQMYNQFSVTSKDANECLTRMAEETPYR